MLELSKDEGIRLKLLRANNPLLIRSGPGGIDKTGSFLPAKNKINRWIVQQTDIDVLEQIKHLEKRGANRRTVLDRIDCRLRKLRRYMYE